MADKPNLRQKLAACVAESERVEKRGENRFAHYKFAQAADVFAEARVPLAKYGIVVVPVEEAITDLEPRQTRNEGVMYRVRVKMRYVVMDGDSDEKIEMPATGEGEDSTDKAIAKAKTFALKYAIQQLLLLPTGDDPEADESVDRGAAERGSKDDKKRGAKEPGANIATAEECAAFWQLVVKNVDRLPNRSAKDWIRLRWEKQEPPIKDWKQCQKWMLINWQKELTELLEEQGTDQRPAGPVQDEFLG